MCPIAFNERLLKQNVNEVALATFKNLLPNQGVKEM
jgi:hypothetical protein